MTAKQDERVTNTVLVVDLGCIRDVLITHFIAPLT